MLLLAAGMCAYTNVRKMKQKITLVLLLVAISYGSINGMKRKLQEVQPDIPVNESNKVKKPRQSLEKKKETVRALLEKIFYYWGSRRDLLKQIVVCFEGEFDPDEKFELLKVSFEGRTALYWAVYESNQDAVRLLLESLSIDQKYTVLKINDIDNGTTVFHWIMLKGNCKIAKLLLAGLSIEQKFAILRIEKGWTALHLSAAKGSLATLQALLESLVLQVKPEYWHRAQTFLNLINMKNNNNQTALQIAQKKNFGAVVVYFKTVENKAQEVQKQYLKQSIFRNLKATLKIDTTFTFNEF